MEERTLLRIAWACIVLGFAGLLACLFSAPPAGNDLLFIDGRPVVLEGRITGARNRNPTLATLRPDDVKLVAFQDLNLKKNDRVLVKGKFDVYRGEKEIVVDRIIRKN